MWPHLITFRPGVLNRGTEMYLLASDHVERAGGLFFRMALPTDPAGRSRRRVVFKAHAADVVSVVKLIPPV